jgi:hypothetical protein
MELLILPTIRMHIKMKKILFAVLVLLSSKSLFAQEAEDVGWVARFGAAVGVTPIYVFPNFDPVNAQIKEMKIDQLSTPGMFVVGGGGYAYIMLVDNLRIGGMGVTGTKSTGGTVGSLNKEVKYNYSFGGVSFEYTLPFIQNIAVSVGTVIGTGTTSIEIFQNSGIFNWSDTWRKVNDGIVMTNQVSDKMTNSFYSITPTLNIDIPLSRFVAVRVGGGYVASFANDWKINNEKTLNATPSDLSSNSFFIQTGIFFGLIAF